MVTKGFSFVKFICAILSTTGICYGSTTSASSPENDFVLAGYFPDYRSFIDVLKPAKMLSDIILFSISPSSTGKISDSPCCLEPVHYHMAREARLVNPDLKIFVSIGGGERSDNFAELLSTKDGRSTLVQELIALCRQEDLNGIDLDWEGLSSKEEYISYILLIRQLSSALHSQGLLLSIALHAKQFLPKEVYDNVDRVNLMAYDMISSLDDDHHASHTKVEKAIDDLIQNGCDKSKIVLGLAAYGRHKNAPSNTKSFTDVLDDIKGKYHISIADIAAKNEYKGYLYDGPNMIKEKVTMAFEKGLKGVFLWELGHDYIFEDDYPGGVLLQFASVTKNYLMTHKAINWSSSNGNAPTSNYGEL